jgi:hypothetical protein
MGLRATFRASNVETRLEQIGDGVPIGQARLRPKTVQLDEARPEVRNDDRPRCPSAGGGDAASEQDDKAGNDAEAWEEETGSASFSMGIHNDDPGVGRVRGTLSVIALGTSPAREKNP